MDRDVGVGTLLSFAIVALVAVAFHRPERPPAMTLARPSSTTAPGPDTEISPTPGVPLAEAERVAPKVVRPASARRAIARASSSFTRVLEGETLADVARRAYGSADAVEALWRSNRDQLDGPEGPIRPGMILRTP